MMPFPPFYPSYYRNYYNRNKVNSNYEEPKQSTTSSTSRKDSSFDEKSFSDNDNNTNNYRNDDCIFGTDYFEIFGLKLYFDDILLICLIFFLYNEGVEDKMLFLSLVLLLLS